MGLPRNSGLPRSGNRRDSQIYGGGVASGARPELSDDDLLLKVLKSTKAAKRVRRTRLGATQGRAPSGRPLPQPRGLERGSQRRGRR